MARRDPPFYSGGDDGSRAGAVAGAGPDTAPKPTGFFRFVSTLQIVASLLAVPLGLASGYSIYRANFSVETTCQILRGNIITLLDKSVDAGARRMLVRRDVAAFEQNCAAVDPDATAAFKTLLAAGAAPPPPKPASKPDTKLAPKAAPEVHAAVPAVEAAPKVGLRSSLDEKQRAAVAAPAAQTARPQQDASVSDTKWLAGVRQALESHAAAPAQGTQQAAQSTVLRQEAVGAGREQAAIVQPAWIVPAQPVSAPAVRAPQADANHPVPPASIPSAAANSGEVKPVNGEVSRSAQLGAWIAQIPLLGPVTAPLRN